MSTASCWSLLLVRSQAWKSATRGQLRLVGAANGVTKQIDIVRPDSHLGHIVISSLISRGRYCIRSLKDCR